jgi:CRP-like cAMP-binding protein
MLENFLRPKLDDLFEEHGAENVWLQQDAAKAHTSRRSPGILREMFPGRVVSLRGDIGRPPPKAQAYRHRSLTLEGLKEAISQEVAAIPPKMALRVMEKYRERLNQCNDNEGRQLSDVVFNLHISLVVNALGYEPEGGGLVTR